MSNQYEVLGKAPTPEDLKKLSPNQIHLTIKNLNAGYGKMEILHNFDLFVNKAQSLCLIGPNGAGKSTILHSIYGFTNIFSGQIEIDGKEITNLTPAEKLKSVGIAYILQDNSVFPDMTVEENLLMGGYIKDKTDESYEEAEKIFEKYERFPTPWKPTWRRSRHGWRRRSGSCGESGSGSSKRSAKTPSQISWVTMTVAVAATTMAMARRAAMAKQLVAATATAGVRRGYP